MDRTQAIMQAFLHLRPEMVGFFNEVDAITGRGMPTSGSKAAGHFGKSFKAGFGKALKGLAIGTAITGGIVTALGATVLKKGLSRALNIQDAQASLKGLGYEVSQIKGITDDVLGAVRGTAYALDEGMKIAGSALAAGIPQGDGLTEYLKLIADTATITKSPINELGAIFNKVTAKGAAYTEELNQLVDKGLPIFSWLQEEYGVTAVELSKMVTKGQVDAKTFRKVIEENIGGAALESGKTATGAWVNVQAALGRLGERFVSGGVAGAPKLFTSISNATDRLTTAIGPLADKISGYLVVGIEKLVKWIDTIDFNKVVADMDKAGASAFTFGKNLIAGDWAAIGQDFKDLWADMQGWDVLVDISDRWNTLISSTEGTGPILAAITKTVAALGDTFGELIVNSLPIVAELMSGLSDAFVWLGDNAEVIAPLIVAVVVAIAAYRVAQLLANAAAIASIPLQYAQIASNFQLASAQRALATQMAIQNGVQIATTRSRIASIASMIAQRAAIIGGAIATGISTGVTWIAVAAQWAWNAAMLAFPLTAIIVGIVALVAGIIYLATQTTFFQDTWKNVTKFIEESVVNIAIFFIRMGRGIGNFFGGIAKFFMDIWKNVYNFVTGITNGIIRGINFVIRAINSLNIPIPEWARNVFGGAKTIGFNIKTLGTIPSLYSGGDAEGSSRGTLVNVGEMNQAETITNRGRTNQLILNALKVSDKALKTNVGGGDTYVTVQIVAREGQSEEAIGRSTAKYINRQQRR